MFYTGIYPILPLPVMIYLLLLYLPVSMKNGMVLLSCIFEPTLNPKYQTVYKELNYLSRTIKPLI